MAKARKLPSGAWQTRPTKKINGQNVSKCFTVHPKECGGDSRKAKSMSELLAREWIMATDSEQNESPKIRKVLENYIDDRKRILSPRTIHDYNLLLPFYESVMDICMDDIKTADIQALVNEWSISVTAKTIRNRLSLLLSALDYAGFEKKLKLRLPQKRVNKVESPDTDEVYTLLGNADNDFKPVIALAAFGSLRRGEIAALKGSDISRDLNTVYVHADVVQTDEGLFYKDMPKTSGSVRVIDLPPEIIAILPEPEDPDSFVFSFNLNQISKKYDRLRKKCGIKSTFHSLRHYAASFRSDMGIPQKYIEEVGGWSDDSSVLKRTYDNALASSRRKYTQMANKYITDTFESVLKIS